MNTVYISTKNVYPQNIRGDKTQNKTQVIPGLQKVGACLPVHPRIYAHGVCY